MPKIVELKENRGLLRRNFDGYKLSLDAVPVIRMPLTPGPYRARLGTDQYSLLHVELFSMQNLLQVDPWIRSNAYFVNNHNDIICSRYNENTGGPEALETVFSLGVIEGKHTEGDYNFSLRFISEQYCVTCDGLNTVILFDTGDRYKCGKWKEVARAKISHEEKQNFMIYDCRFDIIEGKKQVSLALGKVEKVEKTEANDGRGHCMLLHWAQWSLDSGGSGWTWRVMNVIEGKGSLYYCAFEPKAEALIISSNLKYNFRVTNNSDKDSSGVFLANFKWSQTENEISINFYPHENVMSSMFSVECSSQRITVRCEDKVLLHCDLYSDIYENEIKKSIENDLLQVTLKKKALAIWPYFDSHNKAVPEDAKDDNVEQASDDYPVVNLEAPLEDCDYPMNTADVTIDRFHLPSASVTHSILLGSSLPIFSTTLRAGFPAAIVTRHDVDASLWLQNYNQNNSDEWNLRHEGSLPAFGYVQASKQQKKFIDCSPDLSYAIICETHRHIFLYKCNNESAVGLRNRNGPQSTIGKQQLITLENEEILGIATSANVVTLLTDRNILYLQINQNNGII